MAKRWRTALVAAALVTASAVGLPGASSAGGTSMTAAPVNTRAMWLWGDQPAEEVVTWAKARNVSEIFVYVSPSALTNGDLGRLQDMKWRADSTGIRLTALGGDSAWVTDPAAALAWQRTVVTTGVFAGIHLAVEPYLTPGWTADPQGTRRAYLALLDKLRAGSALPIEADVPFWFGEYTVGGKNLADEVLKRVRAVTVMSYRDTATGPNSILEISQDWLRRGATTGQRVRLGVETGPLPDCPYCTFAEEGATRMGGELAKVDTGTRVSPAFAGVAIHRYGTWRALGA
jgi:hypothetical protein